MLRNKLPQGFSTLYTKIPLDKLIEKVSVFVRKVYAGVLQIKTV